MYRNSETSDYFCCEMGLSGYISLEDGKDDSSGCAVGGYTFSEGDEMLGIITRGKRSEFPDPISLPLLSPLARPLGEP